MSYVKGFISEWLMKDCYRMTYKGLQQCMTLKNLLQNDLLWRIYNRTTCYEELLQCLMLKDLLQNDFKRIITVSNVKGFISEWLLKDYYSV